MGYCQDFHPALHLRVVLSGLFRNHAYALTCIIALHCIFAWETKSQNPNSENLLKAAFFKSLPTEEKQFILFKVRYNNFEFLMTVK